MKTNILLLIMATTGLFSCGQTSKSNSDNVDIETINSVRHYEYADAMGKRVIMTNSLPRGTTYTAPNGDKYFKVIFWSGIINETDNPLEMDIHFPVELYEVPGLPGNHYKILVPPDTMTVDKEPLYDYGMTGLKSFLDNNINKPSSIKRTINPKESTGVYVILLSLTTEITPGSTMRTGLGLKGQNLVYKISRYASKEGFPLISEKEINCGSINLKDLTLGK
jgi:hypothetical protein